MEADRFDDGASGLKLVGVYGTADYGAGEVLDVLEGFGVVGFVHGFER